MESLEKQHKMFFWCLLLLLFNSVTLITIYINIGAGKLGGGGAEVPQLRRNPFRSGTLFRENSSFMESSNSVIWLELYDCLSTKQNQHRKQQPT